MLWIYATWNAKDGFCYDEQGNKISNTPRFSSGAEADVWFEENDWRVTVR